MQQLGGSFAAVVSDITEGLRASHRLAARRWLAQHGDRGPASTNQDGGELPFQRWFRFKEAFAPRAVVEAIAGLPYRPTTCTDPFGGSGTTALTCQFLGIRPTTIEVNPFLADLIEAKLARYDLPALTAAYGTVVERALRMRPDLDAAAAVMPATLIEPGVRGRWVFGREAAERIVALREAVDTLPAGPNARLLKILLGSLLIGCSNVVVSGKGRRYRSGWHLRPVPGSAVGQAFEAAFAAATDDIRRHRSRPCESYSVLRGDARILAAEAGPTDFALFSPPYPNSFDYTDVYNVELWMLGYLLGKADNRALRESTLRSHVQIKRAYGSGPDSPLLRETLKHLSDRRGLLWDFDIPEMVGAYFADLGAVLSGLAANMPLGASAMMVVGDSRYAGIMVDVARIAVEIAAERGFVLCAKTPVRSMRASPQQGGRHDLGETLVHLTRT